MRFSLDAWALGERGPGDEVDTGHKQKQATGLREQCCVAYRPS
jgi:hypothetical protein